MAENVVRNTTLGDLPDGCIGEIASMLDSPSAAMLRETCSKMHHLIKAPVRLNDPTRIAVELGYLNVVRLLAERCPHTWKTHRPLYAAIRAGHYPVVEYLCDIIPREYYQNDALLTYMAAVYNSLAICRLLVDRGVPGHDMCSYYAANSGNLEILKFFHEKGSPLANLDPSAAALRNNREMLEYVYAQGLEKHALECSNAISAGHVELFKYMHEVLECPVDGTCLAKACSIGDIALFEYLEARGCRQGYQYCAEAAGGGQLEMLDYLIGRGQQLTNVTMRYAVNSNNAEVVRFLIEHGCPKDDFACRTAAERGNLEILKMLREHGCALTPQIFEGAAAEGHVHVLQFALEAGIELTSSVAFAAARNGQFEVIKFLHENELPLDSAVVFESAECAGEIDLIENMVDLGYEWPNGDLFNAAAYGRLQLLRYAHDKGRQFTKKTGMAALDGSNVRCLQFLLDHGCPFDKDELLLAADSQPVIKAFLTDYFS